jgi:hypothetical protein
MAIVTSTVSGPNRHFYFDKNQSYERAQSLSAQYNSAQPFPHIVLDDFLDADFAEQILNHFPGKDASSVLRMNSNAYLKRGYRPDDLADNNCRQYLYMFTTGPFLQFLEALTGIGGLIPDPYFSGGGLHETERGGGLGVHTDFNLYSKLNLIRRINVLVYLNKDWKHEYGGNLELWDAGMTTCVTSVAPLFNRCVVFNTDKASFHGHPEPLSCPEGRSRRSIALYYYTAPTPHIAPSPTLNENTDFQVRPGTNDGRAPQ